MEPGKISAALIRRLMIVSLFAIAMGLLESAVVIYLREIMYPQGFRFPLEPVHPDLALTEMLREAATLIMLFSVGLLAGKRFSERFAWFVFSFAIWDIFYYVFLWLLIGWPSSLMTWDVLFLIPATWTGPVITPLVITIVMIVFSLAILVPADKGMDTRLLAREWGGLILGSLVLIYAFIHDYIKHMLTACSFSELLDPGNPVIILHAQKYIPDQFPWWIFFTGIVILLLTITWFILRIKRSGYSVY